MKTIMIGAVAAFGGMLGIAAQADAAPVRDTVAVHLASNGTGQGSSEDGPTRPGGKTHFPRNGMTHKADKEPVTGQGPNQGTPALRDSLGAALGNGS
ncbi:MAG: hypothetical protein ACRC20_03630 [Segniliparus sp.]|uniref:hypothetical protein n=1 Tax=Segniliparus sp. TaxID=2804064 RepID=UPI003F3EE5F0